MSSVARANSAITISLISRNSKLYHVQSNFPINLQHCFTISYRRENQRQYELKATSESECNAWIGAIREAR